MNANCSVAEWKLHNLGQINFFCNFGPEISISQVNFNFLKKYFWPTTEIRTNILDPIFPNLLTCSPTHVDKEWFHKFSLLFGTDEIHHIFWKKRGKIWPKNLWNLRHFHEKWEIITINQENRAFQVKSGKFWAYSATLKLSIN